MNSGRFAWLLCLALAVFVAFTGQIRALDACEANEKDRSISALDDSLITVTGTAADEVAQAPARLFLFDSAPPSDRLIVSDVFRPPNCPRT